MAASGPASPEGQVQLLIVDDEDTVLVLLGKALSKDGYAVETARTLADAQEILARRSFDLLLIDKNLPDGSGLSLARERTRGSCEVVLMSGYANLTSAVEALQAGVADYLIKPIDLDDLRARVKRVLEHLELRRHNQRLMEELRRKNEVLQGLSVRDPLTHLYGHAYFQELLQREVLRSSRLGQPFSVILFDIDDFKRINDTMGHASGERVVKAIGDIVRGVGDGSGPWFRLKEEDVGARFGADQFALILPEATKAEAAVQADALRRFVEKFPFHPDIPRITISAGVASCPDDARDRDGLVAAAKRALQAAKRAGRNRMVAFSDELRRAPAESPAERRYVMAAEALETALRQRSFRILYQPIVDSQRFNVIGYEALCRPVGEVFDGPLDLFAVAERAGRMRALGRVLRELCVAPMAQLPDDCRLFINLRPQELDDRRLLEFEPHLAPWADRIVFEITESDEIRDFEQSRRQIARLRKHGFEVALDDLGAGYAGLNSLALLEPDYVKLDMGMIRGIHADSRTARLIEHLLEFASGEGMRVVAEGIETQEELDVVSRLGVPYVQGYYFSRPEAPFPKVSRHKKA